MERLFYLNKLIEKKQNGLVKVITGIRRCGKSYLLFTLYKDWLLRQGITPDHIIEVALDKKEHEELRNPDKLYDYIISRTGGSGQYFIFIDEIQLSYRVKRNVDESVVAEEDRNLLYTSFYDVLNDLMARKNMDLYVTGSNSRMLSKDVATNFRDRASEIQVFPLSFAEFYGQSEEEKVDAWESYLTFGGMPLSVLEKDEKEKAAYLSSLFNRLYIRDIQERHGLKDTGGLESLIDVLFSAVGSLTNPHKLAKTMESVLHMRISDHTITNYLGFLEDAFILKKASRYDVKGKSYLDYPAKYYATDIGLRNARLNFRQLERTHLMENVIYNDLVRRGYAVDVGVVEISSMQDGKQKKSRHEIDFVVNTGFNKIYIQSAFSIDDPHKKETETLPLRKSGDFFKKFVITGGNQRLFTDEDGIFYVGVIPFLLDESILNK